ncbi:MAG: hypothetical protein ACUVQN_04765 [Caldisericia bacterium]
MDFINLFLNQKKFFLKNKDKKFFVFWLTIYLIFTIILIFTIKDLSNSKEFFYGSITQIIFNFIFLIFLALFLKVFLKMYGFDRSFILSLSDTLIIFLPSYIVFVIVILINRNFVLNYLYSLIILFTYKESFNFLDKTIFYIIYLPRTVLILYTIIGIRYISNLNYKKSIFITLLIYFIFYVVYVL